MIRMILLVALVLRIAAAFYWQDNLDQDNKLFRFGDSETYWTLANKIATGKPYDYAGPNSRIFRTPLYPLFIAPATWFEGRFGVLIARIAGCFAGSLAVGLVMLAAYLIADRKAAVCAGILTTIYPGAIGMSVFILSEAIFCPLCLLSLIAWHWATRRRTLDGEIAQNVKASSASANQSSQSLMAAAASGITCGLACLARPSWILWPGLLALLSIPNSWRSVRQTLKQLIVFAIAVSITMSPWWVRNYWVTGHFVPTTLQVGPSLFDGLHPGASGASDEGMSFSLPFEIALHAEDAATSNLPAQRESFEWRLNQRMLNAAIRWAWENPSDTVWLALIKFQKMWSPWPTAKEVGGVWICMSESVVYVMILAFACVAIFCASQIRQQIMLYVAPTIYFATLHLVFVGSVRYRQPAILMMCVVAGIGAAWMLERINERVSTRRIRKP